MADGTKLVQIMRDIAKHVSRVGGIPYDWTQVQIMIHFREFGGRPHRSYGASIGDNRVEGATSEKQALLALQVDLRGQTTGSGDHDYPSGATFFHR